MNIVDVINTVQKYAAEKEERIPTADEYLAINTLCAFGRSMVDGFREQMAKKAEEQKRIITPKKDIIIP